MYIKKNMACWLTLEQAAFITLHGSDDIILICVDVYTVCLSVQNAQIFVYNYYILRLYGELAMKHPYYVTNIQLVPFSQ